MSSTVDDILFDMDPINPIAGNPEALNPEGKSSNSNITIISMALFVLMSLVVVGFLYYQNQQLKSMLASYQVPVVSPTPTATTDPTADWKTYINEKGKFTFKYPDDVTIENQKNISNTVGIGITDTVKAFNSSGGSSGIPYFINIEYNQPLNKNSTTPDGLKIDNQQEINVDGKVATQYVYEVTKLQVGFDVGDKTENIFIKNNSNSILIQLTDYTKLTLFNQILSTFKFTSASPSASIIPVSSSSGTTKIDGVMPKPLVTPVAPIPTVTTKPIPGLGQ